MAMATSLMRIHPEAYTTVIGLSGFIVDTTGAPELESLFDDAQVAKTQPPLFWGYDQLTRLYQAIVLPKPGIGYGRESSLKNVPTTELATGSARMKLVTS